MTNTTVMKCLVTAGNTLAPLDSVRGITNIFSGRTGAQIALELHRHGHDVVLLTSRPEAIREIAPDEPLESRWELRTYRFFDELQQQMQQLLTQETFNALIHSAAVSDYLSAGIYSPASGTHFEAVTKQWGSTTGTSQLIDVSAGKVKSSHEELWIRMTKAPKLVDQVRRPWGFTGKLVKFKLEVGVDRSRLEAIAEASRLQSNADLMCANTLESMHDWAILGPINGHYIEVRRAELARRIVMELEAS